VTVRSISAGGVGNGFAFRIRHKVDIITLCETARDATAAGEILFQISPPPHMQRGASALLTH
jgi:hypothetical protein